MIIMVLFIPLQGFLGKKTSILRLRTALCTDERVRLMNEIIAGIQVIKMYAWEYPFGKMVDYIRRKEMKAIINVNYLRSVMGSFIMFSNRISVFTTLVSYVLLGNFLTAEKAFVITSYYNILRNIMTVYFPLGVAQLAETLVSFNRLQTFMMLEEASLIASRKNKDHATIKPTAIVNENGKEVKANNLPSIDIQNLKAKWSMKSSELNLNGINLNIRPKTLVVVIGPVGSGKSRYVLKSKSYKN